MQHFKFVNWRIRGLVFWCHEQFTYLYKHKFKTHQVFWLKFDDREVRSSFHCAKSAPVDFYDCQGNRIRNSANKATVKKSMVTYVERRAGETLNCAMKRVHSPLNRGGCGLDANLAPPFQHSCSKKLKPAKKYEHLMWFHKFFHVSYCKFA